VTDRTVLERIASPRGPLARRFNELVPNPSMTTVQPGRLIAVVELGQ
jgi:hypothetical protein